jgi:hypothetical protein
MRDRELLERSSLLPPQIPALAGRLGQGFEHAACVEDMVAAVKARAAGLYGNPPAKAPLYGKEAEL